MFYKYNFKFAISAFFITIEKKKKNYNFESTITESSRFSAGKLSEKKCLINVLRNMSLYFKTTNSK